MRIPAIEHLQQLQQHVSCNWAEKAGGSWNTRVACSGGRWFRVLAGYLYFGKWNSGTWWKISSLYRINASATWQLLAASANRKSQIWKFGWNNLPERNFMSTGAMGSGQRSTYRLNYTCVPVNLVITWPKRSPKLSMSILLAASATLPRCITSTSRVA